MPHEVTPSIRKQSLSSIIALTLISVFFSSLGTVASAETQSKNKTAPPAAKPDAAATPTPAPTPPAYDVAPASGRQGKDYEVVITSNRCIEDLSENPPKTNPRNSLKDLDVYAPDGSGIKVTNSIASDCRVTGKLSLASDAPINIVKLRLLDKQRKPQVFVDFSVTGITAGPIPPGLNKGQVDVMWSVLPDQVVHDNFGAKVATEYFCIDAVIGNDSGYDIQIASIGFTAPSLSADSKNPRYRIPNTGYRVVRGTLQRRELFSPRNLILNAIKVAGPLLTGFTPFFHNAIHATNFSEFINIISNPLEKGFETAVPDTVPFQVNRLDDMTWRDDRATRTVIPNNIQTRIMTFVPKGILFPEGKTGFFRKTKPAETNAKSNDSKANSADTNKTVFNRHYPDEVMQLLGDIVIIGEQIEHINRIRVVSTGLETPPSDSSISGKVKDACDTGVNGVTMTLSGGVDFTPREVTTNSDGTYTFVNIPLGRTYTVTPKLNGITFNNESPGTETFTLNGPQTNLNFRAEYELLTISGKVIDKDSNVGIAGAEVKLTGNQIKNNAIPVAITTPSGDFSFQLSVSDLKLQVPTATFTVTGDSNDKATFAASSQKTWTCQQHNVDLVATGKKATL